ncbi:excinuclease ABC subunit A [Pseudooceanicola nitratireducens]|uniref:excinuclease ABC subunit A n=1 Tax=Pseudooceanicola nitratireducens TaxID=517719 RepID=UPI003C7BD858
MKLLILPVMAALAAPLPALAKPGNGPAHHGAAPGHAQSCPPGLAKKSPACVPPGQAKNQAKKMVDHTMPRVGDRLDGSYYGSRYILVRDPGGYGLDPYGTYYRVDGQVIQVDRETSEVIALIGAVSNILN